MILNVLYKVKGGDRDFHKVHKCVGRDVRDCLSNLPIPESQRRELERKDFIRFTDGLGRTIEFQLLREERG